MGEKQTLVLHIYIEHLIRSLQIVHCSGRGEYSGWSGFGQTNFTLSTNKHTKSSKVNQGWVRPLPPLTVGWGKSTSPLSRFTFPTSFLIMFPTRFLGNFLFYVVILTVNSAQKPPPPPPPPHFFGSAHAQISNSCTKMASQLPSYQICRTCSCHASKLSLNAEMLGDTACTLSFYQVCPGSYHMFPTNFLGCRFIFYVVNVLVTTEYFEPPRQEHIPNWSGDSNAQQTFFLPLDIGVHQMKTVRRRIHHCSYPNFHGKNLIQEHRIH